jgi:uncharacterized membrane protein YkoI
MRLPRTETTLAAVLLLAAAPFALAVPPPAPANTPGTQTTSATPPGTTNQAGTPPGGVNAGTTSPGTINSGMAKPDSTTPDTNGATAPAARPGAASPQALPPGAGGGYPGAAGAPGAGRMRSPGMRGGSVGRSGHGHTMGSSERVPQSDIQAAKNVKVSLRSAIDTARKQHHGKVISARFEMLHGKPEYLIRTFERQRHEEWLGHIDARTGKLIGKGRTIALERLRREDRQELSASSKTGTTLEQAVREAEKKDGGKALAAGLSARNGKVSYRTELLKGNGRTQMAMISPSSGKVSRYR